MSLDNLIQWLKNPALLDKDSMLQLRALLEEYPCFTVARTLYLKNLLSLSDLHFSKELIRTAISVPDRRRLYYFMEDKPMPDLVCSHEKELSAGEGFSIIDRFLHSTATETSSAGLNISAVPFSESEQYDPALLLQDPPVQVCDSVSLSQDESSFSLDYVSYLNQSLSSDGCPEKRPEQPMHGQDLIDAFLTKLPETDQSTGRLQHGPLNNTDKQDLKEASEDSAFEDKLSIVDLPEDTFTETLAKIYLKQKRYGHALEIFRSLSLKYPEKNVYFADQIRFLEKLIINIKNN